MMQHEKEKKKKHTPDATQKRDPKGMRLKEKLNTKEFYHQLATQLFSRK